MFFTSLGVKYFTGQAGGSGSLLFRYLSTFSKCCGIRISLLCGWKVSEFQIDDIEIQWHFRFLRVV